MKSQSSNLNSAGAPPLLLQHFDSLADTPDAVSKLRDMVLQLAVRGSLVPQDPKDEPAKELASRVISVAKQVAKERELKLPAPEFSITDQDKVFPLPNGWTWVKLGDLCIKLGAGSTPLGGKRVYQKAGVKFLRSQNVWDDGLRLDEVAFISPTVHQDMESTCVESGDVLLNITGASIGRSALVPDDFDEANVSQHVSIIRLADKALRHFIHLCVTAPDFQSRIMQVQVGVSREGLSMARLKEFVVALPPLGEQRRIVAKVKELLTLCDELEAAQVATQERRTRLVHSALDHLTAAKDEQDFRKQCSFILHNSSLILDSVPSLRQAILSLAAQGRLTVGWRESATTRESGQEFLCQVQRARKMAWVKRQAKDTRRVCPDPVPYELTNLPPIPKTWVWASADAVCAQITDGEHIQPPYQPEGLPMLSAKHVRDGYVTLNDAPLVATADFQKAIARCEPSNGDILIVSVGATTGRSAIVSDCPPFAIVRSVLLLKPLLCAEFFLRWLQSNWCFTWMTQASGASAQPHLYIRDTKRMPIPVPPLAEQQQIVAKVDELMRLCDALEAQLTTAQTTATHLLGATLDRALKGES